MNSKINKPHYCIARLIHNMRIQYAFYLLIIAFVVCERCHIIKSRIKSAFSLFNCICYYCCCKCWHIEHTFLRNIISQHHKYAAINPEQRKSGKHKIQKNSWVDNSNRAGISSDIANPLAFGIFQCENWFWDTNRPAENWVKIDWKSLKATEK